VNVDIDAPRCLDSAGYLSHLGIELTLKTSLLCFTGNFPDDHSLANLLRALEANGVQFALGEGHNATVKELDQFYLLRYPQAAGSPSVGDLAWPTILSLFEALAARLPEDLRRDLRNLDRTRKFGRVLMQKPKDKHPLEGHAIVVDRKKRK
jgi:hypothetical protein